MLMTHTTLVWLIVIAAVITVLGGASMIVANNADRSGAGASVGFIH
jgi:hypothetical protein